jgi:TPR repeat protein
MKQFVSPIATSMLLAAITVGCSRRNAGKDVEGMRVHDSTVPSDARAGVATKAEPGGGDEADSGPSIAGVADFDLSQQERRAMIGRAAKGDGAAALSLYNYYQFIRGDRAKAAEWLRVAARNGDPTGQYNLAILLLERPTAKNVRGARRLLEMLAERGDIDAIEKLKSLPKSNDPERRHRR